MKLFLLLLFVLATFGQAQIIVNGGFEANPSYSTFSPGTSFSGWSVTPDSSAIVGMPLSILGTPHQGVQLLVPAYTSTAATTTVEQSVSGFIPGNFYQLKFFTSAYSTPTYSGVSSAVVSLGSASIVFSYEIAPEFRDFGSPSSPWVERTLDFFATVPTAVLSVSVSHGTTDPYIGFDSFSIVPEPRAFESFAMAVLLCTAVPLARRLKFIGA